MAFDGAATGSFGNRASTTARSAPAQRSGPKPPVFSVKTPAPSGVISARGSSVTLGGAFPGFWTLRKRRRISTLEAGKRRRDFPSADRRDLAMAVVRASAPETPGRGSGPEDQDDSEQRSWGHDRFTGESDHREGLFQPFLPGRENRRWRENTAADERKNGDKKHETGKGTQGLDRFRFSWERLILSIATNHGRPASCGRLLYRMGIVSIF